MSDRCDYTRYENKETVLGSENAEGEKGSAEEPLAEAAWRNTYEFLKLTEQQRAALEKNPAGVSPLELKTGASRKIILADNSNTLSPCDTRAFCTGTYCTGPYCTKAGSPDFC